MSKKKKKRRKKKIIGKVIRTLVLIVAIGVFAYAAFQLYTIFHSYHTADSEYESIAETYTSEGSSEVQTVSPNEVSNSPYLNEVDAVIADGAVPLSVDWDSLKAENPDTIGWIYIEGEPSISYPIVQSDDNDYYLKHTFQNTELFIGAIFMDCTNSSDFSDPNTIIYGHRINTGSMFGNLKNINNQSVYDEHPYFWILTPNGNYRYLIYSIYKASATGDAYTLFSGNGKEFLEWEETMQSRSEVSNDVKLSQYDHTVLLSTCTDDSSVRLVVLGKCVSTQQPPVKNS